MKANKSRKSEKYNDKMSSASSRKGTALGGGSALAKKQQTLVVSK